ncbi:hypothetical protein QTI51_23165 [Variovorax sp. J22G73]|jgi:hypothetical protein|uniref:hypothetical protein n=1 Tax=unclassified Variovorax TaxID=663243 RepID=UPI000D5D1B9E|nr:MULTISPECIES: hypothetical protein [unclassified Variovorax]MDM0007440.1 hypothetical protein [Variovorax sp. J22R203]MDM0100201.1 hypothetical protein [Variovorax sp. J22G73]
MADYLWVLIPLACLVLIVLGAIGVRKLQGFTTGQIVERAAPAQVLAEGVPAVATVLATADTEMRVDLVYVLTRLTLRVEAAGPVPSFIAETVVPISPVKLAEFSEGRLVRVKVDLATRQIAIDQPLK